MKEVTVRYLRDLQQEVKAGRHTIIVDEPEDLGGEGRGPDPYDLLLGALGACTAMTLSMYAKRKGIHLDSLQIILIHDKIHAQDCENCETKEGRVDRIKRRLFFSGNLSDEEKAKLAEVAAKCPVHQTLTHEVKIEDEIG